MSETKQIITVTLPDIGEGVVEGEVVEWRKNVGDLLQQDEPVVVVMTDKATVELPAPNPGKLIKQYYKIGEIAHLDKPLYDIETSETPSSVETKSKMEKVAEKKTPSQTRTEEPKTSPQPNQKALATPATRKLAKELGIDLSTIQGTGREGRITDSDIAQFASKKSGNSISLAKSGKRAAPDIAVSSPILHLPHDEESPIIGLRHTIAEKMVESKYLIPHFSFFDQLDATRLIQLRENVKTEAGKYGIHVTFMPFFIRALSLALKHYPQVNGSVDIQKDTLVIHKQHNIGIAKKTSAGLIVCVLKNVQEMTLHEIIRSYDALMQKAKEEKLERSDMIDSTITISNFGTLGGQWATPIINYPEIAILGIAKVHKQPVVRNNEIVIRELLNLSWSFDHRVIDGDLAAEFSNQYISLLENPAQLL